MNSLENWQRESCFTRTMLLHISLWLHGCCMHDCGFELVDHPPYSPDLVPSKYFLFPNMNKCLAGKQYWTDDEVISPVVIVVVLCCVIVFVLCLVTFVLYDCFYWIILNLMIHLICPRVQPRKVNDLLLFPSTRNVLCINCLHCFVYFDCFYKWKIKFWTWTWTRGLFEDQDESYTTQIQALQHWWKECVDRREDYVEK